ncbi:MAG: glycosyl transferase, partial [Geobacteraceae bacterium GWB2_52_12]
MAFTLLRRLENNENVDLSVLVLNHGTLAERLWEHHIKVHVIDERTQSFHQVLHKTRKLLHHCSPDIVHSHRYKENILALLARGMKKRIRLVCTQHGLPENYGKRVSLQKYFTAKTHLYLLSRFFSAVVAVSTDVQSFFLNHSGFKKEHVAIIHNGIELPGTLAGRNMTAENFVIGSSGRLFHVKDYPLLCEVARSVSMHTRENVRFELAGEGPQREPLETLIKRYGMGESFLLRGHQEDMDSFYKGLHLYINTSIHEGIPMTVLEAL